MDIQNAYLVAQGTRVMRVWLGDALHRKRTARFMRPPSTVAVSRAGRPQRLESGDHRGRGRRRGEIFLAFGTANGFEYLNEVEYRLLPCRVAREKNSCKEKHRRRPA